MLIGLPVLSAVFGGFFFKYLPKYAAKVIMVFHIAVYGIFMITMSSDLHYLYAVAVLWPIELIMMAIMNSRNKAKNPQLKAWEQEDVKAVDLTPWKYRKIVSVIVLICVIAVYIAFSPLGIGA